jgi:hypothetical protein
VTATALRKTTIADRHESQRDEQRNGKTQGFSHRDFFQFPGCITNEDPMQGQIIPPVPCLDKG